MSDEILDQNTIRTESAPVAQIPLPSSGGILTMGILSIVFAGLIGLILGIVSISMSSNSLRLYNENPSRYTLSSYKNVKAGRVCAIVGISLLGLVLLVVIVAVAANA